MPPFQLLLLLKIMLYQQLKQMFQWFPHHLIMLPLLNQTTIPNQMIIVKTVLLLLLLKIIMLQLNKQIQLLQLKLLILQFKNKQLFHPQIRLKKLMIHQMKQKFKHKILPKTLKTLSIKLKMKKLCLSPEMLKMMKFQ